jgi:hypothetical protein
MSTTIALFNRPTRTHRGLAAYAVECGDRIERALRDENPWPNKPTPLNELAYVIRRRGVGLPRGHSLHPYYSISDQETHRKAFSGVAYGDGYCLVTGKFALECDHCWSAADYDGGGADQ